jgi:hypothetical protein
LTPALETFAPTSRRPGSADAVAVAEEKAIRKQDARWLTSR